jgi:hypothetical protein
MKERILPTFEKQYVFGIFAFGNAGRCCLATCLPFV